MFYMDSSFNKSIIIGRDRGRCKLQGCPWRIVASQPGGGPTFSIKAYVGMHICERKHVKSQ